MQTTLQNVVELIARVRLFRSANVLVTGTRNYSYHQNLHTTRHTDCPERPAAVAAGGGVARLFGD